MTQSLAQAQATVTELVELFHRNLGACKEVEVRYEFVEPFFEALGLRYAEHGQERGARKVPTRNSGPRSAGPCPPHRWRAQILCRAQGTSGEPQGRRQSYLRTAALRLERPPSVTAHRP